MLALMSHLSAALEMGTYAVVPVRISHKGSSNPAVIEELHSVKGVGFRGAQLFHPPIDDV